MRRLPQRNAMPAIASRIQFAPGNRQKFERERGWQPVDPAWPSVADPAFNMLFHTDHSAGPAAQRILPDACRRNAMAGEHRAALLHRTRRRQFQCLGKTEARFAIATPQFQTGANGHAVADLGITLTGMSAASLPARDFVWSQICAEAGQAAHLPSCAGLTRASASTARTGG
ncbi:hypothetical protein ACFQU2_28550 [Siccirubricoccus deserti]|uniref:Uncharacterized protein n=1 Tax=Siccirubricoccus deserti TaxID=2013562 RepID=A0A9X0UC63_9PROT|nr:hypothetical protein [Siccirubricoccus deserti]MBC4014892.1 hypothetical protein [Siccirubricoccus deserti]